MCVARAVKVTTSVKTIRSLACASLVLLFASAGCDRNSGDAPPVAPSGSTETLPVAQGGAIDRSHKGARLPDFTFRDTTGKQLKLARLAGTPLLINLWATWCGPCVEELPTLDQLAKEKAPLIRVLTISQDAAGAPVSQFLTEHGLTHLEPWLDPEGVIDLHYNTGKFPTTVYYDAQGREVWRFVGSRNWSDTDTSAMLLEGMIP